MPGTFEPASLYLQASHLHGLGTWLNAWILMAADGFGSTPYFSGFAFWII